MPKKIKLQKIGSSARASNFQKNIVYWLIVRHFLSAELTQELCSAIVTVGSAGKLKLADLFDNFTIGENLALSNWYARPLYPEGGLARALTSLIRSIIWQGDADFHLPSHDTDSEYQPTLKTIEAAYKLSSTDFDSLAHYKRTYSELSHELKDYVDTLLDVRRSNEETSSIANSSLKNNFDTLPFPLNTLLTKHIGDLCADADYWSAAVRYYDRAELLRQTVDDDEWKELATALGIIVTQSKASAQLKLFGPDAACAIFDEAAVDPADIRLWRANASPDIQHCEFDAGRLGRKDERPATLFAPLLIDSHDLSNALSSSNTLRFHDAHRWFWATLRRQTALGSATYSKNTRALYAQSFLNDLVGRIERDKDPEAFRLATRLLIESQDFKAAETYNWTTPLVTAYVDNEAIEVVCQALERAPGVFDRRLRVALGLFGRWLVHLPQDRTAEASKMISFLAEMIFKRSDLGGWGRDNSREFYKVLRDNADARPEFRALELSRVLKALSQGMRHEDPLVVAEAIRATAPYTFSLESHDLQMVLNEALIVLEKFSSAQTGSLAIEPAMGLLSSSKVIKYATDNLDFGRRVAAGLIKASIESTAGSDNIMYTLGNLPRSLIETQPDESFLIDVVEQLRTSAHQLNSSGAAGKIHALLVAPAVSGGAAILDAVTALTAIVRTALRPSPAISFADAYRPLILLARQREEIINAQLLTENEMTEAVAPLASSLLEMWEKAKDNPLIFSGFSIPPRTTPNSVTVHNWTFASMSFAREFNVYGLSKLLTQAGTVEGLAGPIATGKAAATLATDIPPVDPDALKDEPRDGFYASLAKRLISSAKLPIEQQTAVAHVLIEKVFEVGPNGLDASLFLFATNLGVKVSRETSKSITYRQRVLKDKGLRLMLYPFITQVLSESADLDS